METAGEGREASDGLRSKPSAEAEWWLLCSLKPAQKLGHGLQLGALLSSFLSFYFLLFIYLFFIMSPDFSPSSARRGKRRGYKS